MLRIPLTVQQLLGVTFWITVAFATWWLDTPSATLASALAVAAAVSLLFVK